MAGDAQSRRDKQSTGSTPGLHCPTTDVLLLQDLKYLQKTPHSASSHISKQERYKISHFRDTGTAGAWSSEASRDPELKAQVPAADPTSRIS